MIATIYRLVVPSSFRTLLYRLFVGKLLFFFRNFKIIIGGKLIFWTRVLWPKTDKFDALAFIGKYGVTSYPGNYALPYKNNSIEVFFDKEKLLNYVFHEGKKLYFTSKFDVPTIKKLYTDLLIEQDVNSPHRYNDDVSLLNGKTLLDIGCAEGIFTLDNIERIKKAYIFESEEFWTDALMATFEPWKEKVEIIKKYVGNNNSDKFITIDSFLIGKESSNLFIKMDIEGAEYSALQGANFTLKNGHNICASICTYHNIEDPERIDVYMRELGFLNSFTKGFIYWGNRFNKAVIRCIR